MEIEWENDTAHVPRAKRRSRVQSACERCRRQKLKCDQERPCSLCLRSEVPCVPQFQRRRRKTQSRPLQADDHDQAVRDEDPAQRFGRPSSTSPQPHSAHGDGYDINSLAETPREALGPKPSVSFDQISTSGSEAFKQRVSSAALTQEIIEKFSPETVFDSSTSALPGGIGRAPASSTAAQDMIAVEELFGFELPSKRITDYLLNTYLAAVHWFMMVFHEPTLRASYETLMASRRCPRSRSNHVLFILLILSLGAHYAPAEEVQHKFPTFSLDTFRRISLKRVENSLHTLYEAAEVESVQVCILIGSFYMYHGHPNLAYAVLGAGLHCAQLMSLHNESAWKWKSEMAREERRRVFWALFVFDRFAATIFGRPCGISIDTINVKIPDNMGDTTVQHPKFRSVAVMPDGTLEPVTAFSYMKYKFKFYQISSPIIGDLYFHRTSSVSDLAVKVSRINQELVDWFNNLPPELKLEHLCRDPNETITPATRPFMLQALALQIAYDNVQILLHRPLLSQNLSDVQQSDRDSRRVSSHHHAEGQQDLEGPDGPYHAVQQILVSSRDHCWDSAVRSSMLGKYHQCMVSARDSHAAAFLGINLFTAGMVLCVVALSRPLSAQAQLAKQGISRIMSLSRFLSGTALLSAQTTKILKDLVRLIGEKEIKAMLAGTDAPDQNPASRGVATRTSTEAQFAEGPSRPSEQLTFSEDTMSGPATTTLDNTGFYFAPNLDPTRTAGDSMDFPGFETVDFNDGIMTLQQAMFPASNLASPDASKYTGDPLQQASSLGHQQDADHSAMSHLGGSGNDLIETDFNMMTTLGQTWLWDSIPWQ